LPSASAWREQAWRWLGQFVVVVVTFSLVRIAVLNVFYTTGDMHDPGWYASVIWHNHWRLRGPPAYPERFFNEHLAPILWLANAGSYVFPWGKYEYYAACLAAAHALFAAGVYRAWQLGDARVTGVHAVAAAIVALAAAFGGVAVVALALPHPELVIPALALWFMIALASRAYVMAAIWLAACLIAREDAGLHVFGLLVLWTGVLTWRQRGLTDDIRWILRFAFAALSYSVAAFVIQRMLFPEGENVVRTYLGDPPLQHLNGGFVLDRLEYILRERSYLTLPLLLSIVWAALSRNPLLPLGYVAALPWLVFNLLAVHETPGRLAYYYGFPFWLSLAWPLIALRVWRETSGRPVARWPYALLLLASVVGWQWNRLVIFPLEQNPYGDSPFVYSGSLRDRAKAQAFVDYYLAHRAQFGEAAFDQAVFGLLIDHADRTTWLEAWPLSRPPETLIYFIHGYEWRLRVLPLLRTGNYRCVYEVPGTRIRLATKDPLSDRLPVPLENMLIVGSLGTRC